MYYKENEIKEYAQEQIKESLKYDNDYLNNDISEIHHDLFNTDYYIIGYYKAEKWLSNNVFSVIEEIKEYEQNNFGEVTTDFSSSESVVNMFVYILGEYILYNTDLIKDFKK